MDILYVILTALLVVAAVTMILKKVDTRLTFLFLGVIGLAAATIVTGQSVLGDSTTGNVWLDIFDVIRAKFVSTISGTGIRLMMIGGYVMLMNHTKAADVLALGASKLLKPIKNPYIVLALVYMIGAVLKIFITSQIALGLLFMATMFPILTRMGVSKLSAAAACVAIGGMDLGPNDSTGIFAATEILNCTPMDWFTNYELIIGPVIIVYTLCAPEPERTVEKTGFPLINWTVLKANLGNMLRSALAGLWIGFIPGIGESAACWFSYDLAKRSSKQKEKFGHGSEEGIIAAEVANNACSAGALIPALSLGIPGSSTAAIFLSAMFIMNLRPGPTLLIESPGILCGLCLLLLMAAAAMGVVSFLCSKLTIRILTIPQSLLMPLVAVLCAIGAYSAIGTPFALIQLSLFGLLGYLMKLYRYPIAPFVLGLLVGPTADTSLRRALMQYSDNIFGLICRPFGLGLMAVLALLFVLSLKSERAVRKQQ